MSKKNINVLQHIKQTKKKEKFDSTWERARNIDMQRYEKV